MKNVGSECLIVQKHLRKGVVICDNKVDLEDLIDLSALNQYVGILLIFMLR